MTATRKPCLASDLADGLRVVMANVCGADRLEGTITIDDGVIGITDLGGAWTQLPSNRALVASAVVEIVRTAEEIAAARETATRQLADELGHASRDLLLGFDEGRGLTAHGSIETARKLSRAGLIKHVEAVGAQRTMHVWQITPAGREVAAAVRAQRWAASCAGKAVA